jgi:hypothetical protein
VEGIALMDTKVHCILVMEQDSLSLLEQYKLYIITVNSAVTTNVILYLGYTCINKEKVMRRPAILQTFKQNNAARRF